MEHQEAIIILKNLMDKNILNEKEKEAVFTAIGVLGWTKLAAARIKAMGDKRRKADMH